MSGIFSVGISGIQAAQLGMLVTQHNITNSNTPGYNRQTAIQTTSSPVGYANGFQGTGTQVTTVARQYNQFLTDQVRTANTQYASLDTYSTQVESIDNMLADANSGVSPALQDFFKGVQQVASSPSSLPARQAMVSSAQALVNRLQGASQQLNELYSQVNQQVSDSVSLINTYGQQIAKLNEQITVAQAAVNQPANDLLDQRDQLLGELNKLVQVQTIPVGNSIEVMIGKGQVLVMGNQANQVAAVRSSSDPQRTAVALDLGNGLQELPEDILTGGQLGGYLSFRSETLDKAANSLGKVAANLALTFNAQHATGMDLLGNSNSVAGTSDPAFVSDFFTIGSPKVVPSNPNGPVVSAAFNKPQLTSTPDGNYYTDLTNSDYRLSFTGGKFTLTRLSDSVSWSGSSLSEINNQITDRNDPRGVQGFTLSDNGSAYNSGDSFLIEPTREIAQNIGIDTRISSDVRLIAAGLPVRASVTVGNVGSMSAAVTRVRVDDTGASAPGPAYPIKIGVSAAGDTLTLGDANGPYGVTNPGPFQVTAYPTDGSAPSTYTLEYPASSPLPPFKSGMTYEIWDGTSRVQFKVTGTPKPGDTFVLDMNDASTGGSIGVSDGGNVLLLGKLQTQKTGDGGTTSYQGDYAQLVSDIGNKAREVQVTKDAQKTLLDQADAARTAESGVNLDEEAANLMKFQQLYQASARSISVGQKLFDELLSIAGN